MEKPVETALIQARRKGVLARLSPGLASSDFLFFFSGEPIQKPGGHDQTYPFIPTPEYYWLTGSRRSSGILIYCSSMGEEEGWTHFVRPNDELEQLWEGRQSVPAGLPLHQFENWLKRACGKVPPSNAKVCTWGKPSIEIENAIKKLFPPTAFSHTDWSKNCCDNVDSARRKKDDWEINILRKTASATALGFKRAQEIIRPGISEREIQIEIESAFFQGGAQETGYSSIVGAGKNSAVLHFDPSQNTAKNGEIILIDAGAALHGYCSDVTRVIPVDGAFSSIQKDIYDIVLRAQKSAISMCAVGTEWHSVHANAAQIITDGLLQMGILMGNRDSLLENEATRLFFPHGVGHMVGLGVRDVGGRAPGRPPRQTYGVAVRVDFPLEERHVMTVEPGIYFIDALLDNPNTRERWKKDVQWEKLDRIRTESKLGGIRIEDDIVIQGGSPEILTAEIPK